MRRSGAGGIASRTMGSGVHVKQQGTENNDRRFYFPNNQQYVRQQHQLLLQPHQPQRYAHRQLQQQHQPHQQQYVRQHQQLLQPHRSSHHASPKWGIGGPFDCGSNATGWYQEESPPPPNSPMGGVYQCKRCGRLGHMAQICTTPQRFEGTCNSCGQYGHHRHHNCITNTNNKQQQSQMVVADVNFFSGAGGSAMHVGLQGQEGMHVELQPQMVAADVNFFSGAAGPVGRAMGSAMHVGLQG